jgi:hypothetical protein
MYVISTTVYSVTWSTAWAKCRGFSLVTNNEISCISRALSHRHLLFLTWRYFLLYCSCWHYIPSIWGSFRYSLKIEPAPYKFGFHCADFCFQMHMSYWFGTHVGDLLFEGFTINSTSGRHTSVLTSFIAVFVRSVSTSSRQYAGKFFFRS